MKQSIPEQFDQLLDDLQAILLSMLVKIGPFCVALMPAMFTGYAIFWTFQAEAGPGLALLFAAVVGLAIETVGIIATHTAVDLYNAKEARLVQPIKFWLMLALVPAYVGAVAFIVGNSGDAFTPLVRSLGIASPFLTVIVYVAVALARDLRAQERASQHASQQQSDAEQARAEHERVLELETLRMEQEIAIKKAELKTQASIERARAKAERAPASTEPAQSQHKPAQASIECEDCGRSDFGTIQALNAHRRFCEPIKTNSNGHK